MNNKLDSLHIENRLTKWIGYGELESDFWFLGTEEGGETSLEEQKLRISLPPVSDLSDFISKLNDLEDVNAPWMDEDPPLQKTYSGLIRVYLCAMNLSGFNEPTTGKDIKILTEKVREFQRDRFGRVNQNMLVAELMPLSSKDMGSWKYSEISDRTDLRSRDKYLEVWTPIRKEMYKALIKKHNPKVILAYGKGYWKHYKDLVEMNDFIPIVEGFALTNGQLLLIPHTGNAISNRKLEEVGHWIRNNIINK